MRSSFSDSCPLAQFIDCVDTPTCNKVTMVQLNAFECITCARKYKLFAMLSFV